MRSRLFRNAAVLLSLLLASLGLASSPAVASTTTHTPVMGPSFLTANQLAAWYGRHHGTIQPRIPALGNNVAALAQIFINEGRADGVRGDIAFVQSILETGWFGFVGSQIPPDAYNYGGLYAFDGRPRLATCAHGDSAPSRCMGSPQRGVLTQIELLRSYADPSIRGAPGRLIAAPADRQGAAPIWEYFGGNNCPCRKLIWASAPNYGLIIIRLYSQAVGESLTAQDLQWIRAATAAKPPAVTLTARDIQWIRAATAAKPPAVTLTARDLQWISAYMKSH